MNALDIARLAVAAKTPTAEEGKSRADPRRNWSLDAAGSTAFVSDHSVDAP